MSRPLWASPPQTAISVVTLLSAWGALVLSEEGETLVDDLPKISGWAVVSTSPRGMLAIDPSESAPGVEALVHDSGMRLLPDPTFRPSILTGPLVRLVLDLAASSTPRTERWNAIELEAGLTLDGCSEADLARIREVTLISDSVAAGRSDDFAGSASYMGSKKELLPFIFAGISGWAPDTSTFVDLMTGSGIVAGRAAAQWHTIASDSQLFARQLARAQSAGMTTTRATQVMDQIRAHFVINDEVLRPVVAPLLERELDLLHSPIPAKELAPKYAQFVSDTPRYPDGGGIFNWDPVTTVQAHQQGEGEWAGAGSCLMTAYYANVYVGVEQAVQIDNLRFAIAQLEDSKDRDFGLAALLVAVSQVASAYGGHFAQPWATPERVATAAGFSATLKRRTRSVFHEFEARLYALASRSSTVEHEVVLVDGPWQSAVETIRDLRPSGPITVYLDAPYKRDEYSRYYHVLETIAAYNYPDIPLGDLLPARGVAGGRFASEFSTRSSSKVADRLAEVINAALDNGWRVAWSYSSEGDTSIYEVLRRVSSHVSRCSAISAPYRYRRQGRVSTRREVREYLLLLDP